LPKGGLQMLLGVSGFRAQNEERLGAGLPLATRRCAVPDRESREPTRRCGCLRDAAIPVVEAAISRRSPVDMVVGYANVDAARDMTRYLVRKGYGRIGYIGAFPQDNDRARDRRLGYEKACAPRR
jgi:LacI family gluconate utilization system Gnt-I transcriptional repressor